MKHDEKGNELTFEKVLQLYDNFAVYKVHIERCRERDKNARHMHEDKFKILSGNIKKDKMLETMPMGYIGENKNGIKEFFIVSGHHRIRAARKANINIIYVMAYETKLTESQIISKQIAHNSLSGEDDKQLLFELYNQIDNINDKINSGVLEEELKTIYEKVNFKNITVDFDYEQVNLLFLSNQYSKFDNAVTKILDADKYCIAEFKEFEQFKKAIHKVKENENIRNISSIVTKMSEIVIEHYKNNPMKKESKK